MSLEQPAEAPNLNPRADWSLPSWIRHPQLEETLGTRLATLSWNDVERLVALGTPEDGSLDFKRGWYVLTNDLAEAVMPTAPDKTRRAQMEKDQKELAKDVTAFANSSGGLLLLGIEDRAGRAVRFKPLEYTEARRLAVLDKIRAHTTPYLAGVEVGFIAAPPGLAEPDTTADGSDQPASLPRAQRGCLCIYVPPSAASPHAAVHPNSDEPGFRFYLRDGSHVTHMSETQVSTAYRDRFASRDRLDTAVSRVWDDGVIELDRRVRAYLAIAVAPSRTGPRTTIDRSRLAAFKEWTHRRQADLPGARLGHETKFGRGRVVLRDTPAQDTHALDHLLHLYADGRAFAAVGVVRPGPDEHLTRRLPPEVPDPKVVVRLVDLARYGVHLMHIAAGHAVDSGASGDFEILCGLVPGVEPDTNLYDSRDLSRALHHVIVEPPEGPFTEAIIHGTAAVRRFSPVRLTVSGAVAVSPRELTTVVGQLLNEIVAEFGHLPTHMPITGNGDIVEGWGGGHAEGLIRWAASKGLTARPGL